MIADTSGILDRPLEPRQSIFQHNEPRAGKLRRRLEIHLAERFAEIEMLLGREPVRALGAELVVLDIVVRIRAVRHIVGRQIRNLRERVP